MASKIILPWQCRAGRAALAISAQELGELAGLTRKTIEVFERELPVSGESVEKIVQALERAGVSFIETDGRAGLCLETRVARTSAGAGTGASAGTGERAPRAKPPGGVSRRR